MTIGFFNGGNVADPPVEPAGWQEITTPDGYRVVGSQDGGWFVLGLLNAVVARMPAGIGIFDALDRWRVQLAEADRLKALGE